MPFQGLPPDVGRQRKGKMVAQIPERGHAVGAEARARDRPHAPRMTDRMTDKIRQLPHSLQQLPPSPEYLLTHALPLFNASYLTICIPDGGAVPLSGFYLDGTRISLANLGRRTQGRWAGWNPQHEISACQERQGRSAVA